MSHVLRFPVPASCLEMVGHDDEVIGCGWQGAATEDPSSFEQEWLLREGYRDIFWVLAALKEGVTMRAALIQESTREAWRATRALKWHEGAQYVIVSGRAGPSLAEDVGAKHDLEIVEKAGDAPPQQEQVYYKVVEILPQEPGPEQGLPIGYVFTHAIQTKVQGQGTHMESVGPPSASRQIQEHWVLLGREPQTAVKLRQPVSASVRKRLEKQFFESMTQSWRPGSSHTVYSCCIQTHEP